MNDESPNLKVVELYANNLQDIPAMLEACAARIRAGEYGDVKSGASVFLTHDGSLITYGWGETDAVHTTGLFTMGAHWLAANAVRRG